MPAPADGRAAWTGGLVGGALAALVANDRIAVGLLEAVILLLAAALLGKLERRPKGRNA